MKKINQKLELKHLYLDNQFYKTFFIKKGIGESVNDFITLNNDTIKFISQKRIIEEYQWTCTVTAIEPFIKKKKVEEKNIIKVFIGDEKGYLYLFEIECILNNNEKIYEIKSIQIIQSIKAQNSLIKGIICNEKLNVIIYWSDEGIISIINDYSFHFLNIIDLGNNYDIKK